MIRKRCRSDISFFAQYFFPDVCRLPASGLHSYLFARRADKTALCPPERRGRIDVVVAPRGAAKSTLVSLVFPVHALIYGLDPFTILISATERQAIFRLDNIRAKLLTSKQLQRYYGRELADVERNSRRTLLVNNARIDAFSAGSELRGITHGGWRPTWIVLDDVESSNRILSSDYRTGLAEWMSEVVENLGNGYTNIDLIGTLLHRDALPVQLAPRPDVFSKTFRSIITEAEDPTIWEEWRAILFNLKNPDRLRSARRFFDSHEAEMMKGARVLWPEKESYYDLQLMRATRGEAAFNKEKQNKPTTQEEALFSEKKLVRFDETNPRFSINALRKFGFLDPAIGDSECKGKSASGDFAAIITVGVDCDGYIYVLDAWLQRAGPSVFIPKIFELHARWGYTAFGIETNAFQKFLLEPIEDYRRDCGAALDIRGVNHRKNKVMRIAMIEPFVFSATLQFAKGLPKTFMDQLMDFPHGRHDDGPDALAGAVTLARGYGAKTDIGSVDRAIRRNVNF